MRVIFSAAEFVFSAVEFVFSAVEKDFSVVVLGKGGAGWALNVRTWQGNATVGRGLSSFFGKQRYDLFCSLSLFCKKMMALCLFYAGIWSGDATYRKYFPAVEK